LQELRSNFNKSKDPILYGFYDHISESIRNSPSYLNENVVLRPTMVYAVLILDTRWDPIKQDAELHTALGGQGNPRLGVFGSHLTHAWPENIDQLISRLTDTRTINFNELANDDSPTKLRALNTGFGAYLHELGHALGLGNIYLISRIKMKF
jgi:hypothetical protein